MKTGSMAYERLRGGLAGLIAPQAGPAIRIALLGRGIGASLSPVMHRREGERLGLNYHYHLIDFDALGLGDEDLAGVISILEQAGFTGLNVTHPFKQAAVPHLSKMSEEAAAIGAVNTVVFSNGARIGHNTDYWGFAESFRRGLPGVARNRVLQIGAGGAGAAVAHALLDLDAETLFICDTDADRAAGLAARMKRDGKSVLVADTPLDVLGEVDGIVNATPIGMAKYPGVPLDPEKIASAQWVADIVYFPRTTELIARAAERGCPTLPGPGMAIFQAVKAFELFTGNAPSVDAMSRTFQAEA